MDPQDIAKLKTFISFVKGRPELIHMPELSFFKDYLMSLGARLPEVRKPETKDTSDDKEPADEPTEIPKEPEPEPESDPESEVELDMSGVIDEDADLSLEMGDPSKDPSEEDMDKVGEIRGQAQEALGDGKLEDALKLFTDAILLNPKSAVLFAKRAQVLIRMEKPFNAIKDASKAIELNPDQALAYRIRGRGHRLLGHWEEAASDLNTSMKIDYSEEADQWLKEVSGNAKKLHDHKRKYERKREEKELRERRERVRRAQEERLKEEEARKARAADAGFPGGMPGGFPGAAPGGGGGMPGGMGSMLNDIMKDPEILAAFADPEVAAAFQDISANPANIMKYQSNPKIMELVAKMSQKMGGGGGMGGMGGMPNFG